MEGANKVDVHNAEMEKIRRGKKPYQRPKCTQMSIFEFAQFVRRKTLGLVVQLGGAGPSAPAEVPLLLVQGYLGDLDFIRPAIRAPARELEPFAITRGVAWLEMQFADAKRAELQDKFLLLDLRNRHGVGRGFLELIGHSRDLDETLPRVILAASSEQFLGWKGVDPRHCWQLPNCPTPEDLSVALRSFLHLCSILANWPTEKSPPLQPPLDHALSGRTNKG
jgi:hypothetical protein